MVIIVVVLRGVSAIKLRVSRIIAQQFSGFAGRSRTETVGSRGFQPVADDLFLGDLLQKEWRLDRVVPIRNWRWGVRGRRTSGGRAGGFFALELDRAEGGHFPKLLRFPGMSSGESSGFYVPLEPVAGSGPGELSLDVLLQIVFFSLCNNAVQDNQEDSDDNCKEPGGDQLVPPATGAFRAPGCQITREEPAAQEEASQDEEDHSDVEHTDGGDHLGVDHPLAGVVLLDHVTMPVVPVQGPRRSSRRRQAAFPGLRAVAALAGSSLLISPVSLTLDGQRRVQSNRVHPATPQTIPCSVTTFYYSVIFIDFFYIGTEQFVIFYVAGCIVGIQFQRLQITDYRLYLYLYFIQMLYSVTFYESFQVASLMLWDLPFKNSFQ